MKHVSFLFCIHNHQPVGNFDHIFRAAFDRAYAPFLSLLEKHPVIKTTLHFSGPLLEWLETEQPEFLGRIKNLVDNGQVELLGGGFYEPIFSMLRERDILGQIGMMSDFIREKYGRAPAGIWLAERVWEPELPRVIAPAGLSYTLLDSTHFLYAGLSPEEIHGYFVTEKEGYPLALFPIDMTLRYSVPFQQPEKTLEYLLFRASDCKEVAITYGDDGEKFGMWPGTHAWVYEKGWLEAFFTLLEKNQKTISMELFSDHQAAHPPQGPIYLPTLSYAEMMEWALPADAGIRYEELVERLRSLQIRDKYAAFLRGGYWNNFMVKYPESNQMHKKMLLVSEKLEQWEQSAGGPGDAIDIKAAQRELYKAQCNGAYWHGLFGGIYLNYLRHAVYEHLISAENIIDAARSGTAPWISYSVCDFDRDLSREILVSARSFNAYFTPRYGGALFELDFKPRSFNLTDVVSRKMEAYHRKLKLPEEKLPAPLQRDQPRPLHHNAVPQTDDVPDQLFYDWYRRYSFLDHFLGEMTTLENFSRCQYTERGDFINQPYTIEQIEQATAAPCVTLTLKRQGLVWEKDRQIPLTVRKQFSLNDADQTLAAAYGITNESPRAADLWFGIEFNFTLLAGNDPLRQYTIPAHAAPCALNTTGAVTQVAQLALKDEWAGLSLDLALSPEAVVWRFPLETVSRSEDGLEKTFQGSTLLAHWKIRLQPREEKKFLIHLSLHELLKKADDKA
ncbi:MAG: DUF1926 domain-containing protein [Proteobacteria bacterium]|nr:DUF1926 domain-containing protein [Pseudomonadota bacterium]